MQRRNFLKSVGLAAVFTQSMGILNAYGQSSESCREEKTSEDLTGTSQGFFEIRHQHQFKIPLSVLVNPPAQGYSARSSTPLQGQTDFEGLKNRTDAAGNPLDLRTHAHTVTLTQDDLNKLSTGRHVTIPLEKFGHNFYFVANDRTIKAIRLARKNS